MLYRLLANAVVLAHALFIAFVVLGTTILAVNLFAYGVLLRRLLRGS